MIDLNINITLKDKKNLSDLKYKYHLSFSTIADSIIFQMMFLLGDNIHKKLYDDKQKYRLHITPKQRFENIKAKEYENALKVFLRKEWDKNRNPNVTNDKQWETLKQKCLNQIYNTFQNTYEENWDGNRQARSMTRFIRKNPDYVRRLIDRD